ncbi:hypothetical protein C4565_00690 [Candidatus Parcubacteria bacterium]|nr:MAG: hypothetical protein C4565_00690 [Candidatus Parcubacteria bacterium]
MALLKTLSSSLVLTAEVGSIPLTAAARGITFVVDQLIIVVGIIGKIVTKPSLVLNGKGVLK